MPKAILSVHDKTGLVEFARGLIAAGWDLIASGGTARLLIQNDLPVTEVASYTGSPEILGGRVKTLHPAIHGGLLARSTEGDRAELSQLGWEYIDLVAVNLYPFEATIAKPGVTLEEAVENIDIGGVTLIRAAAKNYSRVTVICDPDNYRQVLAEIQSGGVTPGTRQSLATRAFAHTAHYDAAIHTYLSSLGTAPDSQDESLNLKSEVLFRLYPISTLRYGENPHQEAKLYAYNPIDGPLGGKVLQGKALSYNNLLDLDAAWKAAVSFEKPTVAIVKHLSPCGIASADTLVHAFQFALASDPVSAFGGVIAANMAFDRETALALGELFVECIASPGFSSEAIETLSKRKNLRLVDMPGTLVEPLYELRSVNAGVLRQTLDLGDPVGTEWKVVSSRAPSLAEFNSLRFAWKACQHVKSNAIVFVQSEATVGIGGGQPNRVDCVRIAATRAGEKSKGAVMASDAFFPFPDSIHQAADAGVAAVIQPGGSIRDEEVIAACNDRGLPMIFTGRRHFKH
jgi:phosphoribosylaminoimidazolecarboxamide formyltransferase / IMP cyclohydrolase